MSVLGKLVAARHLDGTVVKGWTVDFKPMCTSFHIRAEDGTTTAVETANLKAVFFTKTLEGDAEHQEMKGFPPKKTPEKKIWVEFTDGEKLSGWSSGFASGKNGFFFTPTDPESNLERAFVFRSAVRQILQDDEAVRAAGPATAPAPRRSP